MSDDYDDDDYWYDDDSTEYIDPMAPLKEEEDVVPYHSEPRAQNDPTHRRLRAIAGIKPYVFLTFDDETNRVSLDFWGIPAENLSLLLTTVAQQAKQ
jgi:hypothetical protein